MYLIKEIDFIELGNGKHLMLNLINGAADLLNDGLYQSIMANDFSSIDKEIINSMMLRRYLFKSKQNYEKFINEINLKIDEEERKSAPNFLIVPTYACNLGCIYCYEQTYVIKKTSKSPCELVDIQYEHIDRIVEEFRSSTGKINEEICITIMGGEPLLKNNVEVIEYIFAAAQLRAYTVDIVTNGVDLDSYIDMFLKFKSTFKHIQITVDGIKEIHDTRRIFRNGSGSFDLIFSNMKLALNHGVKTYLRVNVDKSNINELPLLADTLLENFGNDENLQPYVYLLQDGGCSGQSNIVEEKIGIEQIFELEDANPNMKIFYKKFHPAEFIDSVFNNTPFQPVLRHCGAAKNQYIFDSKSNVHKCWHGIGNNDFRTGVFEPEFKLNKKKMEEWTGRSGNNLYECKSCKYRYICGTGCPAAQHKAGTEMDVTKPSCVDYKELIRTIVLQKTRHN